MIVLTLKFLLNISTISSLLLIVTSLVKEKKLSRASRGYYILPNTFSDDFYIILSKCKKAVFSDATALYLHNLSDRTPLIYDVTLPYGYGNCYKDMPNVCLHYVKNANINLGMIEIESPFGMKIKTKQFTTYYPTQDTDI